MNEEIKDELVDFEDIVCEEIANALCNFPKVDEAIENGTLEITIKVIAGETLVSIKER
jgi:hypothetical protein